MQLSRVSSKPPERILRERIRYIYVLRIGIYIIYKTNPKDQKLEFVHIFLSPCTEKADNEAKRITEHIS